MEVKNEKMIGNSILKNLFLYALPIIFSGVLQLLYNSADLIVCNMYGSEHSTAAISSTNSLINLTINLFLGLSVGCNVLMARCFGSKNKEKGERVAYTSLIFALSSGIFLAIFGFFMSYTFLTWMKSPEDVIFLSSAYLRIYFLGVPFSMLYNFGAAILRATGDTKRPFIFLAIAGVFNVLLNLLFVIAFHMDVKGVALATIIAQGLSAIMIMISLIYNKGFFQFKFKEIHFYKREALELIQIGIPAGIQSTIFSLSNVLIQSSINSLGTQVMDGNGASSNLEGYIWVSMNSVAQAVTSFVSANYGAGKKENIKKTVLYGLFLVFLMNLFFGGIILIFHKPLLLLFTKDPTSLAEAKKRLFLISLTYFTCGFMDVSGYSLRGIGYSLLPAIITLLCACLLRVIWIYSIWKIEAMHTLTGLVVSYPISWILTLSIQFPLFIHFYKKIDLKTAEA